MTFGPYRRRYHPELRLISRIFGVAFQSAAGAVGVVLRLAKGRHGVDGSRLTGRLAEALPSICMRLGGALPKVAQILSTRTDLLPPVVCTSLSTLQDRAPCGGREAVSLLIRARYGYAPFQERSIAPVASATVAVVCRATRADDGREVAVKLQRPGIRQRLEADCAIARTLAAALCRTRAFSHLPLREVVNELAEVLTRQTDFAREAANLCRLRELFRDDEGIWVPSLHADLCTSDVLCMEFIGGTKKLTDPSLDEGVAKKAVTKGLRALYKMIFNAGYIHCDMHPGNVLVGSDGRFVILDTGFVSDMDCGTRRSFAEFFLALALRDGRAAARIVRETAIKLPVGLAVASLDNDITRVIQRAGGSRAGQFQVARFVAELFSVQRKHGVYGTSKFTLPIMALLVYEGIAKQRFPELDFQEEAIPFIMEALVG